MTPGAEHEDTLQQPASWFHSPTARRLGLVIGLGLFFASIIFVWRHREIIVEALRAVGDPDPGRIGLLLVTITANLALSGVMFHLLISRYGRVGFIEMQALIASTMLLNYAPLRPGLFGRIAYHKAVHGIRARDSAKTVLQAVTISIAITIYLACALVVSGTMEWNLWWMTLAPIPVLIIAGVGSGIRIWAWASAVRLVEMLLWALRYHLAFGIVGLSISYNDALAIACAGVIATMVPLVSNGLGLREWSVGWVGTLVTPAVMGLAITAELVNRAAEILVALVCGTAGLVFLARRKRLIA